MKQNVFDTNHFQEVVVVKTNTVKTFAKLHELQL